MNPLAIHNLSVINPDPQLNQNNMQERFVEKAELYMESKSEQTLCVQAGWYSEAAMAEELRWSANFGFKRV